MSAKCGDSGGVDHSGKPCGSPPVRRVQDIAGRCRHHGDAAGEPRRQSLREKYTKERAQNEARTRFVAARTALHQARKRAASLILEARPIFDQLATATEEFEEADRVRRKLGVWRPG